MTPTTKDRKTQSIGIALLLLAATAHAGPRTSANYTVATDSVDAGGARATSANYTNDGSVGGIVGVSTVASPAETAKHGYIGQLTEVTALQLAAAPTTVNETATRQLDAVQLLDDLTTVAVPAASISWSVQSGPLTGISAGGLATAAIVYEDTAATAQGDYAGDTGTLELTVRDTIADNFGTYAGDGLADDWQVQFFGEDNPMAGPDFDPTAMVTPISSSNRPSSIPRTQPTFSTSPSFRALTRAVAWPTAKPN